MRKNHIAQVRFTEAQYHTIEEAAKVRGISVVEYIRLRALNGQAEPRLTVTLTHIYNTLQIPYDKWNKQMEENFKKGMAYLYDLKNNTAAIQ